MHSDLSSTANKNIRAGDFLRATQGCSKLFELKHVGKVVSWFYVGI